MSCLLDIISSIVLRWTSLGDVNDGCPQPGHALNNIHHLPTHTDAIVGIQDRKH